MHVLLSSSHRPCLELWWLLQLRWLIHKDFSHILKLISQKFVEFVFSELSKHITFFFLLV